MPQFLWPDNRPAALSLTFDDARLTQLDNGLPLLTALDVRATFYVSPPPMLARADEWRQVAQTHEIGNHTLTHPCSGNFDWSRHNALEDYTLERMAAELDDANDTIRATTGVEAQTFAYPCGQSYVGQGENQRSYVPLVAERFIAGRGGSRGTANDPLTCDMAALSLVSFDLSSFDDVKPHLEDTLRSGGWLILIGHDISADMPHQAARPATIEAVCDFAREHGFWVDTVAAIAEHIIQTRTTIES